MRLAEEKLGELAVRLRVRGSSLGERRPRLCVVGALDLLPAEVVIAAARAAVAGEEDGGAEEGRGGAGQQRPCINVALGYTGREDMAQAAARAAEGVAKGWLQPHDISEVRCVTQPQR
jgi:undecaprenyl pyrophosphate synthase